MKIPQSCLTLCNPMNYIVLGILQVRILEWVAFSFSRGSSQPRDRTQVSHTAGRFFTSWVTREAQKIIRYGNKNEKKDFKGDLETMSVLTIMTLIPMGISRETTSGEALICIHSFNCHLWNSYCLSGTVLGRGNTKMNVPALKGLNKLELEVRRLRY